ncbi:hypothetical protein [Pseudomonas brassicae]
MKRTVQGMVEADEPLMREAISALRKYHQAQEAGVVPEEVEHLRLMAESAFQAVSDYQLYALGHQPLTRH